MPLASEVCCILEGIVVQYSAAVYQDDSPLH